MVTVLVALVVLGFALWLVSQIPMDPTIRKILIGVGILLVVLWLLSGFGFLPPLAGLRWRG